jgi:serine/threonine protein kinase
MGSERSAAKLERFDTTERLGEGASGVVYRALDRVRGEVVALKVLSVSDPDSLFRFKGEFRALASLKHRNLLELYELVTHNEQWLLTMELVKGRDFLNFVRPGGEKPATQQQGDDLTEVVDVEAWTNPALADGAIGDAQPENDVLAYPADAVHRGTLDPRRLRSALQQLFEGLKALHASNRIHRDLKPANVLLFDADERLVICDFGLVTTRPIERMASRLGDQFSAGAGSTTNGEIAGTLAFMSPEQATGHAIAPASDYYAVGVMLYQALTGQVPFDPRLPRQVAIRAKSEQRPRHPRAINADAPEDLSDLALALLDPDPAQRPGYSDVMRVAREGADALAWPSNRPAAPEVLIGRHEQIGQLAAALQQARSGLATVALLSGRSGMGKSAVAQAFLNSAIEQENVLVLAGRCYEREQLPHKALDPLIDSLSDHLLSMDEQTVRDLVPPTTSSLARLFPALLRVSYVKELCGAGNEPIDPASKKRRAYASLREILRRLSLRRPLILFIDDLQWGDVESGPWFTELLHPPQPPSLLLLCAYRAEDEERSPLLTALRKTHLPEAGIQTPVVVKVAELDATESNELALACLSGIPDLEKAAALVAREGGGSPFFLRMFADYVRRHGTEAAAKVKLEDLLSKQIEALAPAARQLLSIVATAGRPEMLRVVYDAAQLHAGGQSALRALEAQRLVQTTGVDADDRVEVCHDRIRETAYRLLDANSKAGFHRELARTLERHQPEGAEGLLNHWRAAGERTKAGDYALKAAQKAENSLAFGRAAELLSEALALLAPEPVQARQLEERRGRALVLAGRGVEAADAFFRAMEGAQEDHAMQLRAMATTQLLRAGRLAQAFAELGRARKMLGLAFPKSDLRAVGMLLWRRAQIWLRGLRLRVRRNAKATQLHRIDMQWAIASSLSCMDHLRGSIYQAEHMLTALRSGDPYRMACALGMESTVLSSENKNPARTQRVIDRGLELAGISGESHALSVVKGTAGVSRMLEGRFREAVRLTRESQETVRGPGHEAACDGRQLSPRPAPRSCGRRSQAEGGAKRDERARRAQSRSLRPHACAGVSRSSALKAGRRARRGCRPRGPSGPRRPRASDDSPSAPLASAQPIVSKNMLEGEAHGARRRRSAPPMPFDSAVSGQDSQRRHVGRFVQPLGEVASESSRYRGNMDVHARQHDRSEDARVPVGRGWVEREWDDCIGGEDVLFRLRLQRHRALLFKHVHDASAHGRGHLARRRLFAVGGQQGDGAITDAKQPTTFCSIGLHCDVDHASPPLIGARAGCKQQRER